MFLLRYSVIAVCLDKQPGYTDIANSVSAIGFNWLIVAQPGGWCEVLFSLVGYIRKCLSTQGHHRDLSLVDQDSRAENRGRSEYRGRRPKAGVDYGEGAASLLPTS